VNLDFFGRELWDCSNIIAIRSSVLHNIFGLTLTLTSGASLTLLSSSSAI